MRSSSARSAASMTAVCASLGVGRGCTAGFAAGAGGSARSEFRRARISSSESARGSPACCWATCCCATRCCMAAMRRSSSPIASSTRDGSVARNAGTAARPRRPSTIERACSSALSISRARSRTMALASFRSRARSPRARGAPARRPMCCSMASSRRGSAEIAEREDSSMVVMRSVSACIDRARSPAALASPLCAAGSAGRSGSRSPSTCLSQSATDNPERRAASVIAARVSASTPFRFHGKPDFIASTPHRASAPEAGFARLRRGESASARGIRLRVGPTW